jgi:peptidyl-prolyl cis-trans isomerase C
MPVASARHILVESKQACDTLKAQLAEGADFAELAEEHSLCPSGADGGVLGEFEPGQMVPEFDKVVFSAPVNSVQVVKTQFGWHLVEVTQRKE